MNDTAAHVLELMAERHRAMTADERWLAASSLFDTARAIVESSLPAGLSREQRRLAIARRLYDQELPEAALLAHARYPSL
jgi:hypothetical protein